MSNPMQHLHDIGLNPFAVTLLAESMLKSAYVKHCGIKPLTFEFPVSRGDCAGWAGVRITIEAVPTAAGVIASDQAQGKKDGTALDTHRGTATGDRRTSPDLQHVSSNGQQQDSPRVASDPLRGGADLVVGDGTGHAEQPGGARVHQPLDAAAATAEAVALLPRIDAAIERIVNGQGCMRIPADLTDPDLVLADCKRVLSRAYGVMASGATYRCTCNQYPHAVTCGVDASSQDQPKGGV